MLGATLVVALLPADAKDGLRWPDRARRHRRWCPERCPKLGHDKGRPYSGQCWRTLLVRALPNVMNLVDARRVSLTLATSGSARK
jgi:hypothetical protein